jgi:hypothetical protein
MAEQEKIINNENWQIDTFGQQQRFKTVFYVEKTQNLRFIIYKI